MSTTTDWIVAFSSVAAAAGTVGTLYASVSVLRRDQDDRRSAQARRVTVVVHPRTPNTGADPTINVHNTSEQPIYRVRTLWWHDLGEGRMLWSEKSDQIHDVVAPGETVTCTMRAAAARQIEQQFRVLEVEVTFFDDEGHYWGRTPGRPLREYPDRDRYGQHLGRRLGYAGSPAWTIHIPKPLRRLLLRAGVIRTARWARDIQRGPMNAAGAPAESAAPTAPPTPATPNRHEQSRHDQP